MPKIDYKNHKYDADHVINGLAEFLTENRRQKIEEVVSSRSGHFVPVLEGLYDRGNISAVMRSAEAFGFYKLQIIENSDEFKDSQKRVSQGAEKWLDVKKWKNTVECITSLKEEGFKVYTTHLSKNATDISELDFEKKTAIVFGNEKEGVSQKALEMADANVLLPMSGFTQSFNISVAAALSLQLAYLKNKKFIEDKEKKRLKALYYLKTLDWPISALVKALQHS